MALTTEQQSAWSSDGYLVLKGALSPARVRTLKHEIDRLYKKSQRKPESSPGMDVRNILPESKAFIDLIDPIATFGIVMDLMGPYIQLSTAQALVRVPGKKESGYVHADGGQAMSRIRVTETSIPLQIKLQYFLTDVQGKDRGELRRLSREPVPPIPKRRRENKPRNPRGSSIGSEGG